MSSNLYVDFINTVMQGPQLWSCYVTTGGRTYSSINSKHSLIVTFRLRHPDSVSKGRYVGARHWSEAFDIQRHLHWFELTVEDPAFRWGRRRIFELKAEKSDAFYDFMKEHHKTLQLKAHIVSKERPFDSRMAGIREAIMDLTEPSVAGIPVV